MKAKEKDEKKAKRKLRREAENNYNNKTD